ncbi:hypothetical protein CFR71_12675 [Novacetimonas pomaceti]|uniref:Uncharacterized protein n=1 Tax=Novacetimonas pomaceti TaxID=2021998 RepID=A0A318QQ03_9PROT|nr:hypothetical protein CFR71_12675 [Novacetimonas pomaceti]
MIKFHREKMIWVRIINWPICVFVHYIVHLSNIIFNVILIFFKCLIFRYQQMRNSVDERCILLIREIIKPRTA